MVDGTQNSSSYSAVPMLDLKTIESKRKPDDRNEKKDPIHTIKYIPGTAPRGVSGAGKILSSLQQILCGLI